jgi:hypothetical protein
MARHQHETNMKHDEHLERTINETYRWTIDMQILVCVCVIIDSAVTTTTTTCQLDDDVNSIDRSARNGVELLFSIIVSVTYPIRRKRNKFRQTDDDSRRMIDSVRVHSID